MASASAEKPSEAIRAVRVSLYFKNRERPIVFVTVVEMKGEFLPSPGEITQLAQGEGLFTKDGSRVAWDDVEVDFMKVSPDDSALECPHCTEPLELMCPECGFAE